MNALTLLGERDPMAQHAIGADAPGSGCLPPVPDCAAPAPGGAGGSGGGGSAGCGR